MGCNGALGGSAHLAEHAAVATADDEHRLRVPVRVERHVGDHLLVGVLVALGDLRRARFQVSALRQHAVRTRAAAAAAAEQGRPGACVGA